MELTKRKFLGYCVTAPTVLTSEGLLYPPSPCKEVVVAVSVTGCSHRLQDIYIYIYIHILPPVRQSAARIDYKMGPRWKGKGAETEALSDPMSKIVSELQSSLIMSNSQGLLMSSCVLLQAADATQTDLLLRSCFGDPVITAEKDDNNNKQRFKLSMEEAFYLFYVLKCIQIVAENELTEKNGEQLWMYMSSRRQNFPYLFKAYSHLRLKNWVVKSGSRYGVDFVAYRHHPRLVHSEYAVLVLSGNVDDGRLRVWSDYECTLRLCGSVAKTLLVLRVQKHGKNSESPSSLDSFHVHEQTVTRWNPQQSRGDQTFTELKT